MVFGEVARDLCFGFVLGGLEFHLVAFKRLEKAGGVLLVVFRMLIPSAGESAAYWF